MTSAHRIRHHSHHVKFAQEGRYIRPESSYSRLLGTRRSRVLSNGTCQIGILIVSLNPAIRRCFVLGCTLHASQRLDTFQYACVRACRTKRAHQQGAPPSELCSTPSVMLYHLSCINLELIKVKKRRWCIKYW